MSDIYIADDHGDLRPSAADFPQVTGPVEHGPRWLRKAEGWWCWRCYQAIHNTTGDAMSDPCTRCGGTGTEPRPGPAKHCAYAACRKPAAGYMRPGLDITDTALLCDLHLRPDMHPPELRPLLVRWPS